MSGYQPQPDRAMTAEDLLRECPPAAAAEARALRELLGAAGAPAQAGELAGEAAAMVAFRSAFSPPRETRSQPAMKRTLATVLSVKAAAIAVAFTGMGGVALAAGGALPDLPGSSDSAERKGGNGNAFGQAEDASKRAFHAEKDAAKDAKDAAKDAGAADKLANKLTAKSIASFSGLCNAFGAGGLGTAGKSEGSTAFRRLVTAAEAAGAENVPAFCKTVAAAAALAKDAGDAAKAEKGDKAAKVRGKAGAEHDKAGENGRGAERGKAAQDHSKAGVENPAKVKTDKPAKDAKPVDAGAPVAA